MSIKGILETEAKQIRSSQVDDKWYQKLKKLNFAAFWTHRLGS